MPSGCLFFVPTPLVIMKTKYNREKDYADRECDVVYSYDMERERKPKRNDHLEECGSKNEPADDTKYRKYLASRKIAGKKRVPWSNEVVKPGTYMATSWLHFGKFIGTSFRFSDGPMKVVGFQVPQQSTRPVSLRTEKTKPVKRNGLYYVEKGSYFVAEIELPDSPDHPADNLPNPDVFYSKSSGDRWSSTSVIYKWKKSRVDANKLQHALNGNIKKCQNCPAEIDDKFRLCRKCQRIKSKAKGNGTRKGRSKDKVDQEASKEVDKMLANIDAQQEMIEDEKQDILLQKEILQSIRDDKDEKDYVNTAFSIKYFDTDSSLIPELRSVVNRHTRRQGCLVSILLWFAWLFGYATRERVTFVRHVMDAQHAPSHFGESRVDAHSSTPLRHEQPAYQLYKWEILLCGYSLFRKNLLVPMESLCHVAQSIDALASPEAIKARSCDVRRLATVNVHKDMVAEGALIDLQRFYMLYSINLRWDFHRGLMMRQGDRYELCSVISQI